MRRGLGRRGTETERLRPNLLQPVSQRCELCRPCYSRQHVSFFELKQFALVALCHPPNQEVADQSRVGRGVTPAVEAACIFLKCHFAPDSRVPLELVAERREFTFHSLTQIQQRVLQGGTHVLGGSVANLFRRAELQDCQQREHDCKSQHQQIPTIIFCGLCGGEFHRESGWRATENVQTVFINFQL